MGSIVRAHVTAERLFENHDLSPTDVVDELRSNTTEHDHFGCWVWQKSLLSGYGIIECAGTINTIRAHRLMAWAVGKLNSLPDDRESVVMHRCDLKRCCNPRHLTVGKNIDNIHDYWRGPGRINAMRWPNNEESVRDDIKLSDYPAILKVLTEVCGHDEDFDTLLDDDE